MLDKVPVKVPWKDHDVSYCRGEATQGILALITCTAIWRWSPDHTAGERQWNPCSTISLRITDECSSDTGVSCAIYSTCVRSP